MNLQKPLLPLLVTLLILVGLFVPSSYSVEAEAPTNSCKPNRGLDIVFVLDNSGSMISNDPTSIRISEAKNLVKSLHEYDRSSVVKFNSQAELIQSLTNDNYLVESALNSLLPNGGGTDMSAGLDVALKEFADHGGNNHKIMVVLTDGNSVNNTRSLELAQESYEKNITIYTIGLGSVNSTVLTQIAQKTGGQYFAAPNASKLSDVFTDIYNSVENIRKPKVYSDWTLTQDLHMTGDLVLEENMKMDLNGYDLQVDGDLVLLSCSELRAVSGTITAGNLEQEAGSTLNLNNSQLEVGRDFIQDGFLRVNGEYGNDSEPEIKVHGSYQQKIRGELDLNGFQMMVDGDLNQDGNIDMSGGSITVKHDVVQKGHFDVGQGELYILGNLTINGGPLMDDEFKENKSLNVNGGYLRVGSQESLIQNNDYFQAGALQSGDQNAETGNVTQKSGQFYINYGIVDIYGDYNIIDGWLTMIHGTMDTSSESLMVNDGDYVHVYGDFTTRSPRNHAARTYNYLGKPMNDQDHLTDGILRVDGNFRQIGDKQFHSAYSDRSQNYSQDYSMYNFAATGRHKVILTGEKAPKKTTIEMNGNGSRFNILQLKGLLGHYERTGAVRWNELKETSLSDNAYLASLSINDIPVHQFAPTVLSYSNHTVPASGIIGPLSMLKVDARADDYRNATVEVTGNSIGVDGKAQVKILVTAHDGETKKLYTVNVTVGDATPGKVTSIELDQTEITFIKDSLTEFTPEKATIGYTVYPTNAYNQKVIWSSTDPSVATVSANGIVNPVSVGETTITARTEDGGFVDAVTVKITLPYDLLEGVKTLAHFVEDTDRYNQIMALYDPSKLGIVVPGEYIQSLTFTPISYLVNGTIKTDASVKRVEVRVNDQQLPVPNFTGTNEYLFSRAGLRIGDYLEIIAYNSAGDELERVGTVYPVNYEQPSFPPFGFYSIQYLMKNPIVFNQILDLYPLEELRFVVQ